MNNSFIDKLKNNRNYIYTVVFVIVFGVIWCILFVKCKYGYGNIDETLYIQLAHRLIQGDALIVDEWTEVQWFSYLLFPIMRIYTIFFKTSEGIVLSFRYIYTFVWGIACLAIYLELKKKNHLGAILSSLFFLLYVPYGIMGLSYNTFGLLFLVLSCVINLSENSKISNIISGSFYAFAVLCHPNLVFLSIYYLIYFLFIKKDKKQMLFFIAGILIQMVIFLVFIFSRASLSEMIQAFSIGYSREVSDKFRVIDNIKSWFVGLFGKGNAYIILFIILVSFISIFDKNKHKYCIVILISISILIIYMYINHYVTMNYLVFPFALAAPFLFQLNNGKIKDFLYSLWIPGLIYSICINAASYLEIRGAFSVLSISSIGCICALCEYLTTSDKKDLMLSAAKIVMCVAMVIQLTLELEVRWNTVSTDTVVKDQVMKIERGPEKGLRVSKRQYNIYENVMKLNDESTISGYSLLFLSTNPLYYLNNYDYKSSSYSSWFVPEGMSQLDYYSIDSQKLPDLIIYPLEDQKFDQLCDALIEKYHYQLVEYNSMARIYAK